MPAGFAFLTLAGMFTTLAIAIGLPVIVMIVFMKRLHGKFLPVLIGAGTFIVFALLLEQLLHTVVQLVFKERLTQNVFAYAVYGGLAAALFEETGRFLSMRFLMKKWRTKENALMYGVGHGGAESILLIGGSYISNLLIMSLYRLPFFYRILSGLDPAVRTRLNEAVTAIVKTPPSHFFLAGAERIAAFVLQLCLSYIVYRAVKERKWILLLLAGFLHFFVDAGVVLLAHASPLWLTEALLVLTTAVIAVTVLIVYRKENDHGEESKDHGGSGVIRCAR